MKEVKAFIDKLTPKQKDEAYRILWSDYVREDVVSHAETIGVALDEDTIDTIVDAYVYYSNYDCNLSYWDNIESLIDAHYVAA